MVCVGKCVTYALTWEYIRMYPSAWSVLEVPKLIRFEQWVMGLEGKNSLDV